ncbi:acyl-CoA/acyl-ACP dehydrogenase [Fodinisporobacter ferrooxydans]|uniref:Acyl-CoA/acyl-ACP dehydrogenase n=1 Tax=Fodinisporobacter ferrooxydans TaxID=2901836 RepID=A0ABY4CPE9_9BACL|nr:acyl-CoA/acyl-ACP dehydrogenase [Alicyclobacillaceae bacterium MYW30-H2]
MEHILIHPELNMLRKTIQAFVKEQVLPVEQQIEIQTKGFTQEFIQQFQKKAKERGHWLLGTKKEFGGAGLTLFQQAVLFEEAAQHRFGFYQTAGKAFGEDLPSFLTACSTQQLETYIRPAAQSGKGCYIALWETDESNDLNQLQCSAQRNGNTWVIQGRKSFVRNVQTAAFGIVLVNCMVDNEIKPTLFLLEPDDKLSVKETALIDVLHVSEIDFQNYEIDDSKRIGEVGQGIELIERWLTESQIQMAARCIGVAKRAHELSKQYAAIRVTRGKPLSQFATIRTMLASTAAELQAARLLLWDAATSLDANTKDRILKTEMAKIAATEVASKIVDNGVQIHGGAGFTDDIPFERWYKELRIARLELKSSETLYDSIANQIIDSL